MACFGSPTKTRVVSAPSWPNSREKMPHCTESVSWNSSIRATLNRLRNASITAPDPGPSKALRNWVNRSSKLTVPFRR